MEHKHTAVVPAINLDKLTPEQKTQLMNELKEQEKKDKDRIKNERATYKTMVDNEIRILYPLLQECTKALSAAKEYVFDSLSSLIKMKAELYDREEDQYSHSFSTSDGLITIEIGRNINDGWDDTVNTGIAKVKDFLETLAKDENSKNLVNTILRLLSKDAKGNLKSSRVLQLKKLSEDIGDEVFIDAIKIIQDAYRPTPSKEFVRCIYKDAKGAKIILPLSITEAPFPEEEKTEDEQPLPAA
jgi:hypothetical protein